MERHLNEWTQKNNGWHRMEVTTVDPQTNVNHNWVITYRTQYVTCCSNRWRLTPDPTIPGRSKIWTCDGEPRLYSIQCGTCGQTKSPTYYLREEDLHAASRNRHKLIKEDS